HPTDRRGHVRGQGELSSESGYQHSTLQRSERNDAPNLLRKAAGLTFQLWEPLKWRALKGQWVSNHAEHRSSSCRFGRVGQDDSPLRGCWHAASCETDGVGLSAIRR